MQLSRWQEWQINEGALRTLFFPLICAIVQSGVSHETQHSSSSRGPISYILSLSQGFSINSQLGIRINYSWRFLSDQSLVVGQTQGRLLAWLLVLKRLRQIRWDCQTVTEESAAFWVMKPCCRRRLERSVAPRPSERTPVPSSKGVMGFEWWEKRLMWYWS